MRYLMMVIALVMLSGCVTNSKLIKRVELLEHVVVSQNEVIQGHDKILVFILKKLKDTLGMGM